MLKNISFCYCFGVDSDPENEKRCMTFSFTERARKVLSDEYLFQITDTTVAENRAKSGIPLIGKKVVGEKVFLTKLDKNLYRIPAKHVDPLIKCLFKYLPASFVSHEEKKTGYYPSCVVVHEKKE